MEIERIQQLAELMENDDEKAKVLSTIDVILDTFSQMLHSSRQFLLDGTLLKANPADASAALDLLHGLGAVHGYDFPKGDDGRTVAEYVIRFGREIIYSGRESEQ